MGKKLVGTHKHDMDAEVINACFQTLSVRCLVSLINYLPGLLLLLLLLLLLVVVVVVVVIIIDVAITLFA
jgi:hypothetical protein